MSLRKGKFFPYGIHVKDMKYLTENLPIEQLPPPEEVCICTSQHIGAPATPVVGIGDTVVKGQLIAEAGGAISANVFSSVCGTVSAIEDLPNAFGVLQKHIRIKNNFKSDEFLFPDIGEFERENVVRRIREAGIVGLGGAGFPTAVKLSPKTPLDTLIVNGAECEPYLNCDYRLMLECPDKIMTGIKYMSFALGIKNVIIGIESNKPKAIEIFSKYDVDVVALKKQYPMGSEKHLIYCATGRKVPTGKMPFDVGCCVQNIKTVIAAYEAVEKNKPLCENVMTVSGLGITSPKNLRVPLGTSFARIAEYCGGEKADVTKYVAGGPMMGKAILSLNCYTKKTDSGLLFMLDGETNTDSPTNCINCGRCSYHCPMRLMPNKIEFYTLAGDYESAAKYGAMNCLECGSCAYNCPARRALVQSISFCKAKLKERR